MASPAPANVPSDPALKGPWTAYRTWACTAVFHKQAIDALTIWSLRLGISGAILATVAQQIHAGPSWLAKGLGGLGAAIVALAAYLSKQAQANDRSATWTKSRSAAESLKSGIILYRLSAPPFDGADRASQLKTRVEDLLGGLKNIESRPPDDKAVPSGTMSLDEYIKGRVEDQIIWYRKRAGEYQKKADLYRRVTAVLMGVAAVLAVASTVKGVSVWAPVVATIIAAITAHLKNQQYQMLITMYTSTALRLDLLAGEWAASGKTDQDKAERDTFIKSCEDTMSAENGAWIGLWSKKQ